MNLEFVNHSSVIYDHNGIRLITDPWIEGDVFQEGWRHIAETKFGYEDFSRITHIWFSHEHPDHFFPVNVKKIPEDYRKKIIVLYQFTEDKKVVEFCRKLGFKEVIELRANTWLKLENDFSVMCNSLWGDSWLAVKADEFSILNTNDCYIHIPQTAEDIKNCIGKVDILLTQFSYAQYEGNKKEGEKRKEAAKRKLEQVNTQLSVFKPKFLIPFASFTWFCHEENFFNNDHVNTIWDVENYYSGKNITPVVLYPGDKWHVADKHDNKESISKWREKYSLIGESKLNRTISVNEKDVIENGKQFLKKIKEKGYSGMISGNCKLSIYLYDIGKYVVLSRENIVAADDQTQYDCMMTSETLNYCFRFDWGFNTTHVNARVQFFTDKAFKDFEMFERATLYLNQNLQPPTLMKRIIAKAKRMLSGKNTGEM